MAASPSSSPRLPSPPPMAEDQLGPKSPTVGLPNEHGKLGANIFEDGASRRIRPGTKAADMPEGPPLVPLKDIDTAFQLTEHLKALYNAAIHPDGSSTIVPVDRPTATRLAQPPDGVDKYLWLYELCRFLCQEVNKIIIALFADDPPCSAQTCNEMRASEWQYLCAVHDPPKPCCAIDYCCHTLDWAANVLTSPKNFPSRLALGADSGSGHQQLRQLTNIFRRVYRIFAHAWFQHREMFWKVEGKTGLYVFFKTVCDVYSLIPEDNYTVPPEAEGIDTTPVETRRSLPTVLKRAEEEPKTQQAEADAHEHPPSVAGNVTTATGHTTKRHRQTPSVDAGLITTVPEETEEDDGSSKVEEATILVEPSAEDNQPKEDSKAAEEKEEPEKEKTAVEPEHKKPDVENQADVEKESEVEKELEVEKKPEVEETEAAKVVEQEDDKEKEGLVHSEEVADPSAGEPAGSTDSSDSESSWQVLTDESQSTSADTLEDEHPLKEDTEETKASKKHEEALVPQEEASVSEEESPAPPTVEETPDEPSKTSDPSDSSKTVEHSDPKPDPKEEDEAKK